MYKFNIVYLSNGVRCADQIDAGTFMEAVAVAHVRYGAQLISVTRV